MTDQIRWNARCDIQRPSNNYDDLMRIVAAYYDMYDRGFKYMSPYISRQNGNQFFIPPDKDTLKSIMGKCHKVMHPVIHNSFMNELISFADKNKGKRALIQPHHTTHHSAQFSPGTFEIERLNSKRCVVTVHGSDLPFYFDNEQLNVEQINFIIVRPKLGKLGTASVLKWEVLLFKSSHTYLIDHVDSDMNPRWSGIL